MVDRDCAAEYLRCYLQFAEEILVPLTNRFQVRDLTLPVKILFDDLVHLFQPGDLVFMPEKTLSAFVKSICDANSISRDIDGAHPSVLNQPIWRASTAYFPQLASGAELRVTVRDDFKVGCYYLDYDGSGFSPVLFNFTIPYFGNERDVMELPLYPLRFCRDADELLAKHRLQGERFCSLLRQSHLAYEGWTLTTDPMGLPVYDTSNRLGPKPQRKPEYVDDDVILDFTEAINADPQYKPPFVERSVSSLNPPRINTVESSDTVITWDKAADGGGGVLPPRTQSKEMLVNKDEMYILRIRKFQERDPFMSPNVDLRRPPTGDELALLPRRLFAYSLSKRRFLSLDILKLRPPQSYANAFDSLQLPEDHKRVLLSAARGHLRRRQIEKRILADGHSDLHSQDFIRGKGHGLVVMLHGEPGVGKTATAEAIAQETGRPLFPVSCGNIREYNVEMLFDQVFHLAHLWDCILLIDEADVLLTARSSSSHMEMNNLVSIFLRKLEYYRGILFLTTNRIGKLDPAINSRIHVTLHYPRLGLLAMENIFRINIKRLEKVEEQQCAVSGDPPLCIFSDDILRFAATHYAKHPGGKGAWNGRQIRNAFMVASSLARDQADAETRKGRHVQPQLRLEHFAEVERMTESYTNFRARVLGGDDSRKARLNEERDDDYVHDAAVLRQHQPAHGAGSFLGARGVAPEETEHSRAATAYRVPGVGPGTEIARTRQMFMEQPMQHHSAGNQSHPGTVRYPVGTVSDMTWASMATQGGLLPGRMGGHVMQEQTPSPMMGYQGHQDNSMPAGGRYGAQPVVESEGDMHSPRPES